MVSWKRNLNLQLCTKLLQIVIILTKFMTKKKYYHFIG